MHGKGLQLPVTQQALFLTYINMIFKFYLLLTSSLEVIKKICTFVVSMSNKDSYVSCVILYVK